VLVRLETLALVAVKEVMLALSSVKVSSTSKSLTSRGALI